MNQLPHTIVVVEDDEATTEFLCEFFAMLGITVINCPNGADAHACVMEHQPKAVILDVYLRGMTGVDILRQLRATPGTQMTPVIFFSGSREKLNELMPDYATQGALFVLKPDVMQLKEIVERLVHASV